MTSVDERQLEEEVSAWSRLQVWRGFVIISAVITIVYPLANFFGAPPHSEPLALRLVFSAGAIILCVPTILFPQLRRYARWPLVLEIVAFYIVQGTFLAMSGFLPDFVSRAILVVFIVPLIAPAIVDVGLALGTFIISALVASNVTGNAAAAAVSGRFGSVLIACILAAVAGVATIVSRRREMRARFAVQLGLEERLALLRTRDRLTGLPNFERFVDLCDDAIASAYIRGGRVAVVALDLDHLRELDSQYGTRMANALIVHVARRFEERARNRLLFRVRSDRFAFIALDADTFVAEELAYELLESLVEPFTVEHTTMYVTATAGVAIYPNDGVTVDALLARCDENVRRARGGFHDAAAFISGEPDAYMMRLRDLREDVQHALADGQFVLFYQPCIDTRTRRIVSAEALLRWVHPKYGLISPDEFIPLLESDGTIASVGEWVLREATQACARWRTSRELEVSVNVSLKQFRDAALFARVRSALEGAHLPPQALILELTETVAVQNIEYTLRTMHVCRAWGVKFALDDFGTGYSSMRYLKDLPVDEIKIDGSFMKGLPDDAGDCAIVRAVISLGHSRGCTVYAEGIERANQARWLAEEGCDVLQGTAVSPPLAVADFEAWVKSAS